MSRALIPKSRLDKARNPPSQAMTPIPPIAVDIIPGRFTEADWYSLLQTEEGEVHVASIVEELTDRAMKDIFNIYLERELISFTIGQAKDAILQIIAWQFLIHDPGEENIQENHSWQEDEEPLTYITDSWAQGSVPVMSISPQSTAQKDQVEVGEESRTEDDLFDHQVQPESQKLAPKVIHTPAMRARQQVDPHSSAQPAGAQTHSFPHTKQPATRKQKAPRWPKKRLIVDSRHQIPAQKLRAEPGCVEKVPIQYTALSTHCQSCQWVVNTDVTDRQLGSVTATRRLQPLSLPKHQILAQFEVLEPMAEEMENQRCGQPKCRLSTPCHKMARTDRRAALPRAQHQWPQTYTCPDGESSKPDTLSHQSSVPPIRGSTHSDSLISWGGEDSQLEDHLLFPSIVPRSVERGPLAREPHSSVWEPRALRPISTTVAMPALCVQTLLRQQRPHIRPVSALLHSTLSR
uniref:Uncharacterized protein n=1 Tax=Callorhinchus milii TaxID=7868 RepID=V9KSP1_CALMI